MSDTVKLIVEIPKELHEALLNGYEEPYSRAFSDVVKKGIPLDDVKAEIREKSFNHYFEYGEYVGEDCRKERIIYLDQVLEILDNIGKGTANEA